MKVPSKRALFLFLGVLWLASCAPLSLPQSSLSDRKSVEDQVIKLLSAYAANDQEGVIALIDPNEFVMYGSDASEIVRNPQDLRQLMADDFALWRRANFGRIQDLDIRVEGAFASAFFQAPFSAAGQPPVMVRISTVWHKVGGRWTLTQSANTVPTTGSSARELMRGK